MTSHFQKQIRSEWMAAEALLRSKHDEIANENSDLKFKSNQLQRHLEDAKLSLVKQEEELHKALADVQVASER